jgi:hypothetical protein
MNHLIFAVVVLTITIVAAPNRANAQSAWCEANCKTLCTKIWGKGGAPICFANIPCHNYAGRRCASADVVNARYKSFCQKNSGKGTC